MGVDWYPCGAKCGEAVCDAGEFETCEICRKMWHVKCWEQDGGELCRFCPCYCEDGCEYKHSYLGMDREMPGKPSDYDRSDLEDDEKGCAGCECESHVCETMKCCNACHDRIIHGPSEDELIRHMVRNMTPTELARILNLDLRQVREECEKKSKLPKLNFLPYPVRECEECHTKMEYDVVGGFCCECEQYMCTECWPIDADKCIQCKRYDQEKPNKIEEIELKQD